MKTKQILLCLLALFVSITISARVFTYVDQWRLWDVSVIDESKKTVAIDYFHTNTNHSLSGETIKTPRTVTDPSTGEIYSVVAVNMMSFIAQDSEGDDVLFANASNARIIISEGVEEIGEAAFYCLNDISIFLPSTLTYIHKYAFDGFTGQKCTIYVPKGFSLNVPIPSEWTLKESDIVPFYDEKVEALCVANWDTNGDGELSYTEAAAVTSLGNVFSNNTTITSFNELQYFTGLTEINDYAFSRSSLTSVIVPQNVTRIGKYAFARYGGDPNALTTVKLPDGLTDIDEAAFSYCSQLKELHLPQSLRNIGEAAFRGAGIESLVLPEGLCSIPYSMCNYALMKSLVIPSTVTSIGEAAFPVCTNLTSVVSAIEEPFAFGSNAFYNIAATCTLTIPVGTRDAYIAAGWTEEVFKGGIIEADVYVPVQYIDFADAIVKSLCVANWDTNEDGELSYTEAAAVTDLGNVFRQRKIESFDELQYFTGLTSIGQGAFEGSSLTSVTIPGNITSIGYYAFSYCESLTSVVSEIEEPFTLNSSVFSSIASTCTLTVPYGTRDAYIAKGWTENVFKGGVVEASAPAPEPTVADLTADMFHQWTLEEPVEITTANPTCVYNLFQNENNIYGDPSVNPDQFADLAEWDYLTIAATNGMPRLVFNRIHNPEAEYGTEEWKGSTWLEINSTDNQYVASAENDIIVYDLKAIREDCNGMVRLHAIKGKWGPATIHALKLSKGEPAEIEWNNIYFADTNVKALCVANWDTNEDGELDKDEAAAVTSLGEVFKGNTDIVSFNELQYFTGLTSIGEYAFCECTGLTAITIPDGVTSIGYSAFYLCNSLTSLAIPSSVTSINEWNSFTMANLKYITVDENNTVYDSRNNCNAIIETATNKLVSGCSTTVIPKDVTTIGTSAFYSCYSLESIDIPANITQIGTTAFAWSYQLSSVTCHWDEPISFGEDAFGHIGGACTLTVPYGTKDAYIAAGWTEEVFKGGIIDPMEMATFDTAKEYVLQNKQNSLYMMLSEEGVTLSEIPHALQFEEAENGLYYLTDGTYYVGLAGTDDWTMSSAADNKEGLAIYPTLVNDVSYFTLRQSKGLVGVDYPIKENLKCWANKTMSDGDAVLWSINSGEQEEMPADTDVSTLANAIYIESTEGFVGTSISLPVKMKNDLTPVGCSFRLTLPEGLTLLTDTDGDIVYELGNRAKKMSLTYKDWNNGTYDFALSPTTASATINGTEGVFITFHMTIPDDMAEGDRKVKLTKNLIQTMEGSVTKENELTDVVSTISINNYIPGDVNGDRNVSPADAIMILYHYFEVVQNGFNKKAADMNGDGNISPADAIEVLYRYFSAGSANATPRLTPTLDPQ